MNVEIKIIQEALELFHLYGIRALELKDIARLEKISLRLLKQYFITKESLLLKCVHFRISQEKLFKYTDENLTDILIHFAEVYPVLYKNINRRCYWELKKYYNNVYLFLYKYLEYYNTICLKKAEEGIANGYIRNTISPQLVDTFFKGHWNNLFSSDIDNIQRIDNQIITQNILAFAREIATPKGRIYIDKKLKN